VAEMVAAVPQLPLELGRYQAARFVQLEPGARNFVIAGARLGMRMVALGDDPRARGGRHNAGRTSA
jgi:hypothetical protein